MNAIPDLGPIKYSKAFFNKFRDKVAEIRNQVNATAPADAELLSISDISRCLWLSAIINNNSVKPGQKKRPAMNQLNLDQRSAPSSNNSRFGGQDKSPVNKASI